MSESVSKHVSATAVRAVLALAVMLAAVLLAAGVRAESEGPNVHGEVWVDDKVVFLCLEPYREEALMIAKSYNAFLLNGNNKDSSAYQRFAALANDTTNNKKRVLIGGGLDPMPLVTIYEGPESLRDEDRWNVVRSRRELSDVDYDFYVITNEEVPPVE